VCEKRVLSFLLALKDKSGSGLSNTQLVVTQADNNDLKIKFCIMNSSKTVTTYLCFDNVIVAQSLFYSKEVLIDTVVNTLSNKLMNHLTKLTKPRLELMVDENYFLLLFE